MEEFVENFNKVVYGFKIGQVVVIKVNTDTEIQASVTTVNNLEVTELYHVVYAHMYMYVRMCQCDMKTTHVTYD